MLDRTGVPFLNAAGGSDRIAGFLEERGILAFASDVAGRTPINFLGLDMLGSFGAARFAVQTNSPVVVLVTSHPDADGNPYFQLHAPLESGDFADPAALLTEMFRRHEPAVLAWPAAYDSPYGRLAVPSQTS